MRFFAPCIFALSFFALALSPARANTLIEQARQAGILDAETALLYQVLAVRDPQSLPARYRQPAGNLFGGTPAILAAYSARERMSGEYRRKLARILQRPRLNRFVLDPRGRFRIHYNISGRGAVDPTDADANGLPDYIDEAVATLDSVWRLEVESLHYQPPPPDQGLGGGDEYDIYIVELGQGRAYGYTYPGENSLVSFSHLEIDNNYTDPLYVQTRGLDALHVTVAHEFFHGIQFGYYRGEDSIWWQESSSTWMEDVAYPQVDDYLQYLRDFLGAPQRSINSGSPFASDFHIYGSSVFAQFLDQRYERDLIRRIWEELGARQSADLANFDRVIRPVAPGGLPTALSEFAVWNYFTGPRHREGFYREGFKFPTVPERRLSTAAKIVVADSGKVDHTGSNYIVLTPRQRPGGVRLETSFARGAWRQKLILITADSVEVRSVENNQARVSGWDRYDEVVLVLTSAEQRGLGFEYRVAAEYDPGLSDIPAPLSLRLRQNFPNPFRPALQAHTTLPFELDAPTLRTTLSIFAADGQLVRRFDLGARPARTHAPTWDGRNQAGDLVASGIYYYVLETDGDRKVRTLAVVRGE